MTTILLDLAGVLNYLAGIKPPTPLYGPDLAANSAWGAINGQGAKAATLTSGGQPLYSTLLALNIKAGLGVTNLQDINLVCNTLAGTTGLEADLALRVYAGIQ